jgi:REP element-mobilizing transposase RayT
MGRAPRSRFQGAYYHINTKGVSSTDIFSDDIDRIMFLKNLETCVERSGWRCHAYCLMSTHYHLLIETPQDNVSEGMCYLNGTYAKSINRRHGRTGHLMQERYDSRVVDTDSYFLDVIRYTVRNPVEAGLAPDPTGWPWSNCRATAGEVIPPAFLETRFTLSLFSDDLDTARMAYLDFVRQPGSDESQRLTRNCAITTDEPHGKARGVLPLKDVLCGYSNLRERDYLITKAYSEYGYRMTDIARFLKISQSRISVIINRERGSEADSQK